MIDDLPTIEELEDKRAAYDIQKKDLAALAGYQDGTSWTVAVKRDSMNAIHRELAAEALEYYDEYGTLPDRDDLIGVPDDDRQFVMPDGSVSLTDPQAEAVFAALRGGYYELPRRSSSEEIAAQLDISRTALSERLRRAHSQLARALIGASDREQASLWVGNSLSNASRVHSHPHCRNLSGDETTPKRITQREADWQNLEPCPECPTGYQWLSETADTAYGGAD